MTRDQILNFPGGNIQLAIRDCEGHCIQCVPITGKPLERFVRDALIHNAEHPKSDKLNRVRCEVSHGTLVLNSVFGEEVQL